MSYLVRNPKDPNETVYTESLDGYEEWELLKEGAGAKPKEHASWDDTAKKWVVDTQEKAEALRVAEVTAMPRDELVNHLMQEIEELKARMFIVEKVVEDA